MPRRQAVVKTQARRASERVGCVNSVTADLQGDSAFAADPSWSTGPVLETTSGSQSAGLVKSPDAPSPGRESEPGVCGASAGPTDAGKGSVSPDCLLRLALVGCGLSLRQTRPRGGLTLSAGLQDFPANPR